MANGNERTLAGETTPESTQAATPTTPQLDHSFTLQAVMELQKNVGELTSLVAGQQKFLDRLEQKLDTLERKVSRISHWVFAALLAASLLAAAGGYFLDKAWDYMLSQDTVVTQHPPTTNHPK